MLGTYVLREQSSVSECLLLLKDHWPGFLSKIMKTNKVFHGLSSSSLSSEEQSWASRKTLNFALVDDAFMSTYLAWPYTKSWGQHHLPSVVPYSLFTFLSLPVYSFHPWEIWHSYIYIKILNCDIYQVQSLELHLSPKCLLLEWQFQEPCKLIHIMVVD